METCLSNLIILALALTSTHVEALPLPLPTVEPTCSNNIVDWNHPIPPYVLESRSKHGQSRLLFAQPRSGEPTELQQSPTRLNWLKITADTSALIRYTYRAETNEMTFYFVAAADEQPRQFIGLSDDGKLRSEVRSPPLLSVSPFANSQMIFPQTTSSTNFTLRPFGLESNCDPNVANYHPICAKRIAEEGGDLRVFLLRAAGSPSRRLLGREVDCCLRRDVNGLPECRLLAAEVASERELQFKLTNVCTEKGQELLSNPLQRCCPLHQSV